MQGLLALSRAIDTFTTWIGRATTILVPVVVLVGVWNVATRYVGRAIGQILGSNFYIELQWYLFSLIFLLGSSYALLKNDHVRVDVLYGSWPPRRKALVNFLGSLLILIPFCALLIYFSWPAVQNSWRIFENSPDPGGLPRYPIKTVIIISAVLLIIQGISEAIKNLAILQGAIEPEEHVKETGL